MKEGGPVSTDPPSLQHNYALLRAYVVLFVGQLAHVIDKPFVARGVRVDVPHGTGCETSHRRTGRRA